MRIPARLRALDDRVLRRRPPAEHAEPPADPSGPSGPSGPSDREGSGGTPRTHDGVPRLLAVVWRVSALVLTALALVLLAAIAFTLLPTNDDNVVVRTVFDVADRVAGPFRDVFAVEDPETQRVANLGLAAVVYLVLAAVVRRLPTGRPGAR